MNIELKGRKAIITGSTAEGLARAGASVIINGRGRPTGLEEIGPRTSRTALAGSCLWLLFFLFSLTAYAAAGETSRAIRLALLISATRRS